VVMSMGVAEILGERGGGGVCLVFCTAVEELHFSRHPPSVFMKLQASR
jgi:hypothetical protein